MGVCHFPAAGIALRAVPHLLTLGPTAIELTAPPILQMGLAGAEAEAPARRILAKAAKALLFVEFMEGNRVANARKLKELADLMARLGHVRSVSEVIGAAAQNAVRRAHDAGLSKIYGMTRLPAPFVPLSALAISVERLEEAAEALGAAFERHGWTVFFHGHAGSGVLHLHPWLGSQPENAGSRAAAAEASEALRALAGHLPARTAMASPDRR
ncbi:MAG: hypothetical protein HC850_04095 [Rhodomicrobium sp.]|nr:hypothetical protein [Rhodomicrobium sp.]